MFQHFFHKLLETLTTTYQSVILIGLMLLGYSLLWSGIVYITTLIV